MCCFENCSSCLRDSGIPLQVVVVGTTVHRFVFMDQGNRLETWLLTEKEFLPVGQLMLTAKKIMSGSKSAALMGYCNLRRKREEIAL